jgi:hypothetical protein
MERKGHMETVLATKQLGKRGDKNYFYIHCICTGKGQQLIIGGGSWVDGLGDSRSQTKDFFWLREGRMENSHSLSILYMLLS